MTFTHRVEAVPQGESAEIVHFKFKGWQIVRTNGRDVWACPGFYTTPEEALEFLQTVIDRE